ncbi:MAG: 3,4-dihydroxy-2-butanone-4-phosphate synthase [Kordiimonadaceae bacterium]|nr:3,4-dihydroxy-2-butanone-4-phosphate synthase [Kordiimonadaceae bacterium]
MNQTHPTPSLQGTPADRVANAIAQLQAGGGILVLDDETRENEGDLIYAAETMTVEQMAFMIRECSGIICLPLSGERCDALELPQMVADNSSSMGTAFTVSIEAKEGVTTGVSAADRLTTIKTAIDDATLPSDLAKPGHVFPLRAHPDGVMARGGHTEASIELAVMAGFKSAAVLCEITNEDGTMARLPEIVTFGEKHQLPVITIEDLIAVKKSEIHAAA